MSLGFYGRCSLEAEDASSILYSYVGENWNLPASERERLEGVSGWFTIMKDALEGPEVCIKHLKVPRRRRKVPVKRVVLHFPDVQGRLEDGGVVVDELCGVDALEHEAGSTWPPRVVRLLIFRVFDYYMRAGSVPHSEFFVQ